MSGFFFRSIPQLMTTFMVDRVKQPDPDLPHHQYHLVDRRYIYGHDPGCPHLCAYFSAGSHPLGMHPVHFIIMVLNLCIGVCTPPVGTLLFVGGGVAKISVSDVIRH